MARTSLSYMIEHRARALSTVYLTGRSNIQVFSLGDFGELGDLDQLGMVLSESTTMEMLFGVVLKATADPLPDEQRASRYVAKWNHARKMTPGYPFPVVLLLFSMHEDNGYFCWLVEPY